MDANKRMTPAVIAQLRSEIESTRGREVLFVCTRDDSGMIDSADVVARGRIDEVAVPVELCRRGDVVVHNHPSDELVPSRADVQIAARLGEEGIGSAIVDNAVSQVNVLVEPVGVSSIRPIDVEELDEIINEDGAMSRVLAGFSPRREQLSMLRHVTRAFNEEFLLAVEAGTGVGKSFAYLLPTVAWARDNDERIVIATGTIHLQEQLLHKDLPAVQEALGADVPVALVKGRGNYLCRRKLLEFTQEPELFAEETQVEPLVEWGQSSADGSRSDVPFPVSDAAWSTVASEPDACVPSRCTHRDTCFILRARRKAAAARVLVANHHLLFSDLEVRAAGAGWSGSAILPPYRRVVLDEAHNLERNATSFFTEQFQVSTVLRTIARIVGAARRRGLLHRIRALGADPDSAERLLSVVPNLRERLRELDEAAVAYLGDRPSFRVTAGNVGDFHARLGDRLFAVIQELLAFADSLHGTVRSVPDVSREEGAVLETAAIVRRFESFAARLGAFREPQFDAKVLWIQLVRLRKGVSERQARLMITPLDIGADMRTVLFERLPTIVCTSATLAVGGNLSFWAGQTGFPIETAEWAILDSPFPYESRVLVAVPSDAVPPDAREYPDYLASMLTDLIGDRGSTLVLFTSYALLNDVYGRIKPALDERRIALYRQGEDDRGRLLQAFRTDVASVLFATDSFWEGIDVPGNALRQVVIVRLPFRVPSDPVQEARVEVIEATGGNAFATLALPQAVMRLKQGFGRLMRSETDFGAVVVTDTRLATKWYGRVFLDSLPATRREHLPTGDLIHEVGSFLDRMAE